MKYKVLIANVIGFSLLLAVPAAGGGADDGAARYKTKCAHCHGAAGEGKPAMKAPALKGTTLEAAAISEQITKGKQGSKAPHGKAIAGVNEAQAKAIADFVKSLK